MGYILIMKVLVVGFGPHGAGLEACEYYMKKGDEVTIIEMRDRSSFGLLPEKLEKEGVKLLFNTPVDDLSKYDVVVKAPAVPLNVKYFKKARYITNDLSALFESPLVEGIKLIAVVGSKGKTTSASIITHALNVLGGRAVTCGGIGKSGFHILTKLSEEGKNCYTHIVLAMANWQIGDTNYFLDKSWPGIESVLITTNTNKDNLPKELLPMLLCVKGKIVLDKEIKDHVQKRSMIEKKKFIPVPSHFNPYFYPSFEASSYEVLKSLGYSKRSIVKAFKSYKGVPDRLEQVAIKNGILYINDSASTIPESVQFAVKTMGQVSIHLICGGTDKSGELDENVMKLPFKHVASITLLSGSFTEKLVAMLEKMKRRYNGPYPDMKSALDAARNEAEAFFKEKGSTQIVLLSPGSSSFEHFENEFNRGDLFRSLVDQI